MHGYLKGAAWAAALAVSPMMATSAGAAVTVFDVTGIFSNESFGSPLNEVFFLNIGANSEVIGLGWDVLLFADSPSWLSEPVVSFGSSSNLAFVNLTVGVGDNFPGTQSYSSIGLIDLVDSGLSFTVDADGLLRLEFWESFNDFPDDWDAIWESGTISIEYAPVGSGGLIPEPGTWAMLIAGLGLVGASMRRRRRTAVGSA